MWRLDFEKPEEDFFGACCDLWRHAGAHGSEKRDDRRAVDLYLVERGDKDHLGRDHMGLGVGNPAAHVHDQSFQLGNAPLQARKLVVVQSVLPRDSPRQLSRREAKSYCRAAGFTALGRDDSPRGPAPRGSLYHHPHRGPSSPPRAASLPAVAPRSPLGRGGGVFAMTGAVDCASRQRASEMVCEAGACAIALTARACAVAMAAKAGAVTDRHRLQLLRDVLAFAPRDPGWVAAVLVFEDRVGRDPAGAGALLHDWALGPGQPQTAAGGLEAALARIAAEGAR